MRAIIQTVKEATVTVENRVVGAIEEGMLVYFGVEKEDTLDMVAPFIEKLLKMRIFKDDQGKTNLDLKTSGGSLLLVSQFTLAANVYRGNRPSFDSAGKSELANALYEEAKQCIKEKGIPLECGIFGEHMLVSYVNVGPETFLLESDHFLPKR